MSRHLVTTLFLVAAMVFYMLGAALPGTILLVFGGVAEFVFWVRLARGGRGKPKS
jgi:hypothetical protein